MENTQGCSSWLVGWVFLVWFGFVFLVDFFWLFSLFGWFVRFYLLIFLKPVCSSVSLPCPLHSCGQEAFLQLQGDLQSQPWLSSLMHQLIFYRHSGKIMFLPLTSQSSICG